MIPNHKGEIPFVILIIPFLLGIIAGLSFLPVAYVPLLTVIAMVSGFIFIGLNLYYQKLGIYKVRWVGGLLAAALLFLFGWISVTHHNELNRDHYFTKTPAQYLAIKINNEPVLKNGLLRFTAEVEESINKSKTSLTSGTLLVTVKDSLAKNLYYGDELLIPANYAVVDPPFNPAEFNYKKYLANKNIYYQSFLYRGQYAVLAHNKGNALIAFSLRLRQRLVEKFKINMHNPAAIAVASTLILGYKADLSSDVLQAYSKTGTVYVLTVSGSQVAIIYLLLNLALGFLNRFKYGRLIKAVLIIVLVGYYALLTGFSPAVCRAALMVGMVVIGKTYSRYINILNILAVSAFLLLLFNPLLVADVGFQVSYLAVGGLVIFQPVVYQWFKFKNKWAAKFWAVCSVSIAAQVVTFPICAFYFHQFPVYFLVSNLLVVIPATIIMYTGIVYLLLPQVPVLSKFLGSLLEKSILAMTKALAIVEQAPFASVNKIWLNTAEYLLLYVIIISLLCFTYNRKAWLLKASLVGVLLFSLSTSYKKIKSMQTNSIAFLDLRKHMGVVFKSGNSAVVISDLSDTDKNYKYSVQPYLDSSKISGINLYKPGQDINTAFVLKKYNFIGFNDKKILIFDKPGNVALKGKLNTDYIYITGNPHININAINKNYDYRMLVIDGSNSDKLISGLKTQAAAMQVNYNVLKRNKSLLIVSNY